MKNVFDGVPMLLIHAVLVLSLATMILGECIRQVPDELKDAARCDGVGELKIFFCIVLPLIRPAIATVAVVAMISVGSCLWFSMVLAPSEEAKSLSQGLRQFAGQYLTGWISVFAASSLAVFPMLALYVFVSRRVIPNLTVNSAPQVMQAIRSGNQ